MVCDIHKMHQAWGEAVECRKAGRAHLGAFAATLMLSDTRARPSGHAPVATHSAALLLSAFASWREHGQVTRAGLQIPKDAQVHIPSMFCPAAWNSGRQT